jgi:hypothetical protein
MQLMIPFAIVTFRERQWERGRIKDEIFLKEERRYSGLQLAIFCISTMSAVKCGGVCL